MPCRRCIRKVALFLVRQADVLVDVVEALLTGFWSKYHTLDLQISSTAFTDPNCFGRPKRFQLSTSSEFTDRDQSPRTAYCSFLCNVISRRARCEGYRHVKLALVVTCETGKWSLCSVSQEVTSHVQILECSAEHCLNILTPTSLVSLQQH